MSKRRKRDRRFRRVAEGAERTFTTLLGIEAGGLGAAGLASYLFARRGAGKTSSKDVALRLNSPDVKRYLKHASPKQKEALLKKLGGATGGRQSKKVTPEKFMRSFRTNRKKIAAIGALGALAGGIGTYKYIKARQRKKKMSDTAWRKKYYRDAERSLRNLPVYLAGYGLGIYFAKKNRWI